MEVRSKRGLGLIEVLVSVSLMALLVFAYSRTTAIREANVRRVKGRQQIELVRNYIRNFLSCQTTMFPDPPANCSADGPIDVKQDDGEVLVAAVGSTLVGGRYLVRNKCHGDWLQFFVTDRNSGEPTDQDLFRGIPIRCPQAAPPSTLGCSSAGTTPMTEPELLRTIALHESGAIPVDLGAKNPTNITSYVNLARRKVNQGSLKPPVGPAGLEACSLSRGNGLGGCTIPPLSAMVVGGQYFLTALRIVGSTPDAWRVTVEMHGATGKWMVKRKMPTMLTKTFSASTTLVGPDGTSGLFIYHVAWPEFWPANWLGTFLVSGGDVKLTVEPVDGAGDPVPAATSCLGTMRFGSPLVLDPTGRPWLRTVPLARSVAFFDLAGQGEPHRTGWIAAPAAFLTLDRNGDGIIEGGKELFGDATPLSDGTAAPDGFAALARYDLRSRGFIDESDPIFRNLRLWTDGNGDGAYQPGELRSLSEAGVTKLSTRDEAVPEEARLADDSGNRSLRRARFWGPPACGASGCWMYDVYFQWERTEARRLAHDAH